jgi:hypothetical protein
MSSGAKGKSQMFCSIRVFPDAYIAVSTSHGVLVAVSDTCPAKNREKASEFEGKADVW